MNEFITISRSDMLEIRNYEKSDVPFAFYPDMTKKKGTIFLVNKHIDIELLFITDGKLKIHLDNNTFIAQKGEIVVVNPNILHNIIPITESVTYECIIIDRNFFDNHGLSLDNIHVQEIIKDEYLFECITSIKNQLLTNKTKYYIARINSYLLNLSIRLIENYSSDKNLNSSPDNNILAIEKAIKYINKHFNKQIIIDEIAEHVGYSKFYFCRRFKEVTGYTAATYINMQKIKYAHNMLINSHMNINEIASECGFKNVAYFSVTFKKYTGTNPSDVKKSK